MQNTFKILAEKLERDGTVWHYVEGVVYTPGQVDTDFDTMTAEDLEKMAHNFIASGLVNKIDVMHDKVDSGAQVVESFIAREGDPVYSAGQWVLKSRIPEGVVWDDVLKGKLNGYSFHASVRKVPAKVLVSIAQLAAGITESNNDEAVIAKHTHNFYIEFDENGQVHLGMTDSQLDHVHSITATTVVNMAMEHNHRFFVEL